ncbi:MAG TPA: ABC transporter permease [Planctomycetaceae bacterium]|jgi:lipopolysaccharide transport system permease protein|nr:ABC transporter permease [Planctomycetaceae bacterium]
MPEQVRTARDAPILSATDSSGSPTVGREANQRSSDEARDPALIEETVITPRAGWPALGLMDLVHYRDLLVQLTLRNIKVRYKQTLLGVLWAVLQPVLLTLVFAFSLRQFIPMASRQVPPYPVFVLSGMLPWVFFQTAVTAAANSVVSSEQLVTKVYLPRLAIPLSAIAAALIDLGISFVVLVGMMVWYGIAPSATILLLPLAVVLLVAAATGMGTLLAALTVSYRDFRHAVTFLLPAWMIATPTIFLENQSGGLARLNPMTAPIDFFRSVTLGLPVPWQSVLYAVVFIGVLCLVGLFYFRRVEDSFADVI